MLLLYTLAAATVLTSCCCCTHKPLPLGIELLLLYIELLSSGHIDSELLLLYIELLSSGRIDSELLLRQLACYIMVEMCPDAHSDPGTPTPYI